MYYNIIALKLAYYWSDSAMVRLDPISPRMVRSISFYVQIVREVELTIAIHFRAKQRYARVTVATHGAMTPENAVRNPIVCDTPICRSSTWRPGGSSTRRFPAGMPGIFAWN